MIKLKDILKESAPGFENRQFGDPLPTLADVAKEYQEKNGIQVEEGQKREASNIINKFDKAYLNFAKEVRDVIKMVNRSTGEKTDGKIIDKSYSKHLIQLDKLMQSWSRGQQENPNIDESVNEKVASPFSNHLRNAQEEIEWMIGEHNDAEGEGVYDKPKEAMKLLQIAQKSLGKIK
jgi:DNA-binding ferritin-like protein